VSKESCQLVAGSADGAVGNRAVSDTVGEYAINGDTAEEVLRQLRSSGLSDETTICITKGLLQQILTSGEAHCNFLHAVFAYFAVLLTLSTTCADV